MNSKIAVTTCVPAVILNVNGLNAPIKDIGWLNG